VITLKLINGSVYDKSLVTKVQRYIELSPMADGSDVSANKHMRNTFSIFGNFESERGLASCSAALV
jgi:hypothetical protein